MTLYQRAIGLIRWRVSASRTRPYSLREPPRHRLGYSFYFLAIEETSVSLAAIVFYAKPALAPLLALLVLGESRGGARLEP